MTIVAKQIMVSSEGLKKLQEELEYLKTTKRKEVAEAITNDIPNNEKVYLVSDKVINMLNILDKMYDVKRKPKRVTSSSSVKKNEQGMRCQTGYSDNNNNHNYEEDYSDAGAPLPV